jgi:hypothetical protein
MINIADLPAVRDQLARDAAAKANPAPATTALREEADMPETTPGGSAYPAKRLALDNGQYRVVDYPE